MKVCFPVKEFQGMESVLFGHLGSTPSFAIFDEETGEVNHLKNVAKKHEKGECGPLLTFNGDMPDIVVVSALGGGLLRKLMAAGVRVYKAEAETVEENLKLFSTSGLQAITTPAPCAEHHGHQKAHQHGHSHAPKHAGCGCKH